MKIKLKLKFKRIYCNYIQMCSSNTPENITMELNSFVKRYTNEFGGLCKDYIGEYIVIYDFHYDTIGDLLDIKNPLDVRELYIDGLVIKNRCIFHKFKNLEHLHGVPIIKIASLKIMFMNLSKLRSISDIGKWDTSAVTDMYGMFISCRNLCNIGDIGDWDVSNVKDFCNMFSECSNLTCIGDLSKWDVHSCLDFNCMFINCKLLKSIGDLGDWSVSDDTPMNFMFFGCDSLIGIGKLKINMFWDEYNGLGI